MYAGKGYAVFKDDLATVLIETLRPIQQGYVRFARDRAYVRDVLETGAEQANRRSRTTLDAVREALGLIL